MKVWIAVTWKARFGSNRSGRSAGMAAILRMASACWRSSRANPAQDSGPFAAGSPQRL
jgi:hypothetical protein